jgi:hypothetical protein
MHLPQLRSSAPVSLPLTAINVSRQLEIVLTCRPQMPSVLPLEDRGGPTDGLAYRGPQRPLQQRRRIVVGRMVVGHPTFNGMLTRSAVPFRG